MLGEDALRQALGDGASLFGELVPEVRSRLPDLRRAAAPPPDEARFRLWRAVSALLRRAAKLQPLALVLDDLHAADRSSLALLHFVARQLRPMRIVLLGTYRDVEARMDAEASELLSRIGREGSTLPLARLDRGAAARLLRGRAGDVEAQVEARILDSAQGNPLFLDEMMSLRDEQGSAAIVAGEVPHGVREVIRQRLDRLPEEGARCWIWPRWPATSIDPPLLVAASGHDAALGLGASGRGGARRGGRRASGASRRERLARAAFVHALFREVLYRELPEETRRALHGRMAEKRWRERRPIRPSRRARPPRAGGSRRDVVARGGPRVEGRRARPGAAGARRGDAARWHARATRSPRPGTLPRSAPASCWRPARPASGAARSERERPTAGRPRPSRARATTPSWPRGRR